MNIEIDQQQKFIEEFSRLTQDASPQFKDKWDNEVRFINPTHTKMIPAFNDGAIHLLSVELRKKFELLRSRYFNKSL